MNEIKTKEDLVRFLANWVDHSTCSQGKGKMDKLPTGGCGDPHYISRDQLLGLVTRIHKDELTPDDLDKGQEY